MQYLFATFVALTLGIALPSITMAIVRAGAQILRQRRSHLDYLASARRKGMQLPPAWRDAHRRMGSPLPPTRHPRLVKIRDTAA